MNALDRAIFDMRHGPAAQPELYRQLSEGDLWTLLPWHSELKDGEIELKEGMPMPFVILSDKHGRFVPIYSSQERLDEALTQNKVPKRKYAAAVLSAKTLLRVLGAMELRALANYHCKTTGHIDLPPDLLRDLADGSVLAVKKSPKAPVRETLEYVLPADHPTALIQPLFETLKKHRNYRVAWLLRVPGEALPPGGRQYKLLVVMVPRDDVIHHDLELVMAALPTDGNTISSGFIDPKNRKLIKEMFSKAVPLFLAPGYKRPVGAKQ